MLGLADRGRICRLLQAFLGDSRSALSELDETHRLGSTLRNCFAVSWKVFTWRLEARPGRVRPRFNRARSTKAPKLSRTIVVGADPPALANAFERASGRQFGARCTRAADMVLLRLIHAADMPDPASLISQLSSGASGSGTCPGHAGSSEPTARPPSDFRALVALLEAKENRSLPNNFTIMFVWPV